MVLHRSVELVAVIVHVELRAQSDVSLTRLAGYKIVLNFYDLCPGQPLVAAMSMPDILIEEFEDIVLP